MRAILVNVSVNPPVELASIDIGGVAPAVNDLIEYPDKGYFIVRQKVFVFVEHKSTIQVVGITPKRDLEVVLQIACTEMEVPTDAVKE